jgi:ferredoxin
MPISPPGTLPVPSGCGSPGHPAFSDLNPGRRIGVTTAPGPPAFIRMPWLAYSSANACHVLQTSLARSTFARSGKPGAVLGGQTLPEAAAAAGVEIPSACREGQCGTCKPRLLEGRVRMTPEQGLDSGSKARGFVLTCVGRPEGNVSAGCLIVGSKQNFLAQMPGAAGDDLNLAALSPLCPGRLPLAEFPQASEFRQVCGAAARRDLVEPPEEKRDILDSRSLSEVIRPARRLRPKVA